jgi:hypothetical protein
VPSPIVAPDRLARVLLRAGRPDEAGERLRFASAGRPDDEASWLLSRVALQRKDWPATRAVLERSAGFRDSHPVLPEPAPYVGAARCAGCHPREFRAQQASRHARTFLRDSELGGVRLPGSSLSEPAVPSVSHRLRRDPYGRIHQETTIAGRVLEAVVEYAFGSEDRGLTFVGRDRDGRAYELRLSEYRDTHANDPAARSAAHWDTTLGQNPRPARAEEYLGRPLDEDGVRGCLLCHVTDPDAIVGRSGPCASDRAIGCERCHGPAGHHLLAVEGKLVDIDPAIARPRLATGPEVVGLCSGCHSPHRQEVRRDDPTAVRFQGTTLTWSRCYSETDGALDCVTCHDPHRDATTQAAHYEARCLECHSRDGSQQATADGSASDRRGSRRRSPRESWPRTTCPVNPSRGCVACHMPAVPGAGSHSTFTDHFIRVHRD